jgi:hypothetical protein
MRLRHQPHPGFHVLKTLTLALTLAFAGAAYAEGPTCNAGAAEKKLAGAAKTSFLKKCETVAKAKCEASSKEKKLAGAAKTSHEKKCLADAVG